MRQTTPSFNLSFIFISTSHLWKVQTTSCTFTLTWWSSPDLPWWQGTLQCWRLWTLPGCLGWLTSSVSHGPWGQYQQSGRLGWWSTFSEGVLQLLGVQTTQSLDKCWEGGLEQLSSLQLRRSNVDSFLVIEQWISPLFIQGFRISKSTCVLWLEMEYLEKDWTMSTKEPSWVYTGTRTKVRAMSLFPAESPTHFQRVLNSAKVCSCIQSCLWYSWPWCQSMEGQRRGSVLQMTWCCHLHHTTTSNMHLGSWLWSEEVQVSSFSSRQRGVWAEQTDTYLMSPGGDGKVRGMSWKQYLVCCHCDSGRGCLDGWMDGWMDGWIDGWKDWKML